LATRIGQATSTTAQGREVPDDQTLFSPDVLLRRAAAGDAARAVELLARVGATKLLDAVFTQAELAVDDDRARPAGIDAIAELDRAAIEVMDLPQGAELGPDLPDGGSPSGDRDPVLVGWELVTVDAADLETATLTLRARPWQLALVAFADSTDTQGVRYRRVVAAAADGRLLAGQLRFADTRGADLLDAVVTASARDLGGDESLATGLLAALRTAAHH
jgi:hypothetical protein